MGAPACLSRWQACGAERRRVSSLPSGGKDTVAYVAKGVVKPRTWRAVAEGFATMKQAATLACAVG